MTVLSISAITFGFGTGNNIRWKITIWAAMIVLTLLRALDGAHWYLKLRNTTYDATWPQLRFLSGAILSAILWSIYGVTLYGEMTLLELATTMIIISAMAGGAATILAPHLPLVLLYTTIMLLPMSIRGLIDNNEQFNVIGMLGTLFWLAMCSAASKANDFIKQAISIQHKNDELVGMMRKERNEVTRVNRELLETNRKLDVSNSNLEVEVQRRTAELHKLSNRDPLTGLMNRIGFMQHFNLLIQQAQTANYKMSVLFIDLDGFKQINDSLGHQAGDIVLTEVSTKLTQYCEKDCIGRWGGDEFIIILPHADGATAVAIAQAIKSSLTNLQPISSSDISLDATIGIAVYPRHSEDAATLVQLADLTMYHQKHSSPGSVGIYNESLYEKTHHEQLLREGLRQAIEKQQLHVVYQPIIDSGTNQLWAVEALLRWHFNGNWVGPDEFIPLSEKSGTIHEIGNWVLHRACIDASQWPDSSLGVSVNVSVLQLLSDNFIAQVDQALRSSGLAPERLHLEVTESIFADNKSTLTANISALKSRNIRIAIDDFGTGFSSLSLLQSLDFDLIKIDRSFVNKLSEGNDTIVKATLLMAGEFGCRTVAEGVETNEQAEILKSMGVDCLQGYLFSKPLEKNALLKWYTDFSANK